MLSKNKLFNLAGTKAQPLVRSKLLPILQPQMFNPNSNLIQQKIQFFALFEILLAA